MKSLTAKMLMPLAIIAVAALLLIAALVVGGRAVALAQSTHDDLLLVALALGGAAASMANGFGRTLDIATKHTARREAQCDEVSPDASALKLGI